MYDEITPIARLRAEGHTCWNLLSEERCEKCRTDYEARIVPTSYGAGLAELLGLLAEPHACGTFWPFGDRRRRFLAEWIGENAPECLTAPPSAKT